MAVRWILNVSGQYSRIIVRAPNWLGDAVMSIPALRALRRRFPDAHIALQARPWVAELYAREKYIDRVIPCPPARRGFRFLLDRWRAARQLRRERFDCAVLLPNSFESALVVWLARIPRRAGYSRDGRGLLLTNKIARPAPGEIPKHERFYYLELLRRAGLVEDGVEYETSLDAAGQARQAGLERFHAMGIRGPVVGVSPGAAYGGAKRWLPEYFAEAAAELAEGGTVAVFGSRSEACIAEVVLSRLRAARVDARNFAGQTTLSEFIDLAAACRVFLTNDSGAMHVAAALGVPTVAVFGATDPEATGPIGPAVRVVREPVECSPCLLRECPIDHRCMTRVTPERVAREARELLK